MKKLLIISIVFLLFSCKTNIANENPNNEFKISLKEYTDSSRNRLIPVAIYQPSNQKIANQVPVIFSHGYGANKGDDYVVDYPYLLEALAARGFFVISVQHELKTD